MYTTTLDLVREAPAFLLLWVPWSTEQDPP